jgi:hypothetical protein
MAHRWCRDEKRFHAGLSNDLVDATMTSTLPVIGNVRCIDQTP